MARLGRSYPSGQTRLTNVGVINPAPNLFPLPTIQTRLQAVNRAAQVSMRRPLSTRLRPPQVISPVPNLSPLPVVKEVVYAVPRASQSSRLRPMSTRVRPPNVISPTPNLFLPTLGQFYHQAVTKSYKQAQRTPDATGYLNPVKVINPTPNLFLPTLSRTLDKSRHTNRANATILRNKLTVAPPAIFLPSLGYFGKIALLRSYKQAQRTPDSTALLNAKIISPAPNLFLPTISAKLQAVNRSSQSSQRRPLATKLTQVPAVFFPKPTVFLPTLGTHLQAVNRVREAYKFRGQPRLLNPLQPVLIPPNLFLPDGPTKLDAVNRSRAVYRNFRSSTMLRPPILSQPTLFLPTLGRTLVAGRRSRERQNFRLSTRLLFTMRIVAIPQLVSLPTGPSKLDALNRARVVRQTFRTATRLSPPILPSIAPPFLPTVITKLQALNRASESAKRRPFSTKLSQVPALYLSIAPPLLPTLGRTQVAARTALEMQRHRYLGTRLLFPMHVVAIPPNLFLPNGVTKLDAVNRSNILHRLRYSALVREPAVISPPVINTQVSELTMLGVG